MIKGKIILKPNKTFGKLNKETIKIGTILEESNAFPEDVVINKTFYSWASKDRQTGTLKAYKIKQINQDSLSINSINFTSEIETERINNLTIDGKEIPVGLDTSDGDITPDKVVKGYIGYAKGEKIIGELEAYQVEEQIIEPGKSRLVINKLQDNDTDDFITIGENIEIFKCADKVYISQNGGQLATEEEYKIAEQQFQEIAGRVMGVNYV